MRNVPENYQPIFGGWRTVVLKMGGTGWDDANRSVVAASKSLDQKSFKNPKNDEITICGEEPD